MAARTRAGHTKPREGSSREPEVASLDPPDEEGGTSTFTCTWALLPEGGEDKDHSLSPWTGDPDLGSDELGNSGSH